MSDDPLTAEERGHLIACYTAMRDAPWAKTMKMRDWIDQTSERLAEAALISVQDGEMTEELANKMLKVAESMPYEIDEHGDKVYVLEAPPDEIMSMTVSEWAASNLSDITRN